MGRSRTRAIELQSEHRNENEERQVRHWQRQREQQRAANLGFGRILAVGVDKHPIGDCSHWNPDNRKQHRSQADVRPVPGAGRNNRV